MGIQRVLPETVGNLLQRAPGGRRQLESEALRRCVQRQGLFTLLSIQLFKPPGFHSNRFCSTTVCQVHLLSKPFFARTSCTQSLEGIGLSAQSLVDLASEFLFLLGEATELRLSHFDVAPLVLAVAVVALSRAKVDLAHTVVFYTTAAFLDHDVSKIVEEFGEFEASGGAVAVADSRHLQSP